METLFERADGSFDKRREAIESVLRPVADTLKRYEEELKQIEKARTDAYGGSPAARAKLALDIVRAVRERVGDKLLIFYRHTPVEKDGYGLDDSRTFAQWLVEAGVDVLDISPASDEQPADLAAAIKEAVDVPVIGVNEMDVAERAVEALEQRRCDLIAIGRGLIADPDLPRKWQMGMLDGVTACTRENQGCFGNLREGKPVRCIHRADDDEA
jgi:2,4-dienoyl-CoA reductase (NADPH2)